VTNEPLVAVKRESKAEHVLEDHHASESLDGDVAMGINDVACASHSANHHASDLASKEKVWPKPAVAHCVISGDAETVQARHAEDQLRNDEEQAKLGLEDAAIAARHPRSNAVGRHAGDKEAHDGADERARVHVAGRDFVEPQRRPEQDGRQHDAQEHRPPDQRALDQARPQDAGVQE